jgi:hypothetical protein
MMGADSIGHLAVLSGAGSEENSLICFSQERRIEN